MADLIYFSGIGLEECIKRSTGATTGNWKAHLASVGPASPSTSGLTDGLAQYTESTETGYAPVTLLTGSFTYTFTTPYGQAVYPNFSIVFTVAFATVGWVYVTDAASTILIGGAKLATPNTSGSTGGTVNINGLTFQFAQA